MGTRSINVIYHRFRWKDEIVVVVAQIGSKDYVWLSLYLANPLRGDQTSRGLIEYLIHKLRGHHHIHWLPGLTTFRQMSRQLGWTLRGKSAIFDGCHESYTDSTRQTPSLYWLFDSILRHDRLKRLPDLPTVLNREEARLIMRNIRELLI